MTRPTRSALPVAAWCLVGLVLAVTGCAATGPSAEILHVDGGRYAAVFDAAVDVARASGLPPALRDRRAGIIETDFAIAPSLLEPWRVDHATLRQRTEHTIALRRRRARFEFTPAAAAAPRPADEVLAGPDLFGSEGRPVDLTTTAGAMELRVWVYVEQAHTPGVRRSTWTRSATSRTRIVQADGRTEAGTFWTPVSRDRYLERWLLAEVHRAVGTTPDPGLDPAAGAPADPASGPGTVESG